MLGWQRQQRALEGARVDLGGARGLGKELENAKDGSNVKQLLRVINPIRPLYCEPNSLPCRLYHARRTPASPGRTPIASTM